MDVGFPHAAGFDLVSVGDGVAEADEGGAVEAAVALFVDLGAAVGVRGGFGDGCWISGGFGERVGGGCEGAGEGEEVGWGGGLSWEERGSGHGGGGDGGGGGEIERESLGGS